MQKEYICPMHPQIVQPNPGSCPICGMRLELKTKGADSEEDDDELKDMSRRFWIGLFLTIPILLLVNFAYHPINMAHGFNLSWAYP